MIIDPKDIKVLNKNAMDNPLYETFMRAIKKLEFIPYTFDEITPENVELAISKCKSKRKTVKPLNETLF